MKKRRECELECHAALTIAGDGLDVYALSDWLEKPIFKEKEPRDYSPILQAGVVVKPHYHLWCYQTKPKPTEADNALDELRMEFSNVMNKLIILKEKQPNLELSVEIVMYNTDKNGFDLYISPSNIEFASKLGISFDFDIY